MLERLQLRKLLIRLLIGKHFIVVSNLGGIPRKIGFWSCIPVGREVLLINTYIKPRAEPATESGG